MVFKKRSTSPTLRSAIVGEALPPLLEGPASDSYQVQLQQHRSIKNWVKEQLRSHNHHPGRRSKVRALLAVVCTSLGPFPVGKLPPAVCPKDSPIETSSAQYIVHQYIAATGGLKAHCSIANAYAMGRMKLSVTQIEGGGGVGGIGGSTTGSGGGGGIGIGVGAAGSGTNAHVLAGDEPGCFVLWQMTPDKWYVELGVAGTRVRSGCDGRVAWRQGNRGGPGECSRGGLLRPLRRLLHGLDPRAVAAMFLTARCAGEACIDGEDCFVLRLAADYDGAASGVGDEEVIRHVAFGYFSQRSGLLVRLDDTQLTRVGEAGATTTYWEVTTETTAREYRGVDGLAAVPHAGTTVTSVVKFGEPQMAKASRTRVVEEWWIDDAAYNVAGLSSDCFIPPPELRPVVAASDAGELAMVLQKQQRREDAAKRLAKLL